VIFLREGRQLRSSLNHVSITWNCSLERPSNRRFSREVRFLNQSFVAFTIPIMVSSIFKYLSMERGGKPIEYCDSVIFSVASNISTLQSTNDNLFLMFGKVGIKVNISHWLIFNSERQGKWGNMRWCEELISFKSSPILLHPFSL